MTTSPGIDRMEPVIGGRQRRWFRLSLFTILAAGLALATNLGANLGLLAYESRLLPRYIPARTMSGGALVIHGGGRLTDEVRSRFIELAGGPRAKILVIPTAHARAEAESLDVDSLLQFWRPQPVESVAVFHTNLREKANDEAFLKPLREATGVWFCGGVQSAISQAYVGTAVERELKAILTRGGVIGGTSAGAAVMSKVMIEGGKSKAQVGEGLGFLVDTVIDQHFLRRNRMNRLQGVLDDHQGLVGLGIDEGTAVVFNVRDRRIRVLGESYVVAMLPTLTTKEEGPQSRWQVLKPGDEADLEKLKTNPATAVVTAVDFDRL